MLTMIYGQYGEVQQLMSMPWGPAGTNLHYDGNPEGDMVNSCQSYLRDYRLSGAVRLQMCSAFVSVVK